MVSDRREVQSSTNGLGAFSAGDLDHNGTVLDTDSVALFEHERVGHRIEKFWRFAVEPSGSECAIASDFHFLCHRMSPPVRRLALRPQLFNVSNSWRFSLAEVSSHPVAGR